MGQHLKSLLMTAVIIMFIKCAVMENDLRVRRQINGIPLIYPYGATYKLLVGFASPIPNKDKIGLIFAANFQYQYTQFTNISQLSRYYFIKEVSREQREAEATRGDERLVFYKAVADIMTAKGMNGLECMLRAICEAAQFPVEHEGFVGEILHVLLTPDYGKSPFEELDPAWSDEMSMYNDAAVAGRQMFSCGAVYGCPAENGVLDLISTLRDE